MARSELIGHTDLDLLCFFERYIHDHRLPAVRSTAAAPPTMAGTSIEAEASNLASSNLASSVNVEFGVENIG
jgi:hypothetical protein